MATPKKRDSAYWLARLKREYPAIYAKYRSKEITSVRAACIKAGLIHQPSQLDILKREWRRTSPSQRDAFLNSIAPRSRITPSKPKSVLSHTDLVDSAGYLRPTVKTLIRARMKTDGVRSADLMESLGFDRFNTSLMSAMSSKRPAKVSLELQNAVSRWLHGGSGHSLVGARVP